jgi:hypothetical protein
MTRIQGHCPACGKAALFVGEGGYVTCSVLTCPEPDAVSTLLDDRETEHIVRLDADGWTVRHPLRERLGDALMACRIHDYLREIDQPEELGTFRARLETEDPDVWSWEKIA